jgi:hypothetical protein
MMHAWSFAARTLDEIERLLRALGRHRYVREADHRLHFAVDEALAEVSPFAEQHAAFRRRLAADPTLDVASRDPRLWRSAGLDEVLAVLVAFWAPTPAAAVFAERLERALDATGLPRPDHAPFACPPDSPAHPELVLLDWELLPVGDLDPERHAGALAAMEDSGDEAHPTAPVYHEGPILALPELTAGAPNGVLVEDFLIWSDGPYAYADYVFRGAAKAAKLFEPPIGHRDF